jgi:hypothetical protein
MAEHYGCAVLPVRPRKPWDKANVLIAQRWILAVLRHRTFYSLAELNAAIRECLDASTPRLLRQAKKSRQELFETFDHPNALNLPQRAYEYAEWNPARFIQWAGKTGESTARLVETILSTRPYPEQGL